MTTLKDFSVRPEGAPAPWLFPHPLAWAVMAILAVVLAVWSYVTGFGVTMGSSLNLVAGGVLLLLAAGWCCYRNTLLFVPYLAFGLVFFVIMGNLLVTGNYLGVALGFPLTDNALAGFDRAIGFDWPAHVRWVNNHPFVLSVMGHIYVMLNQILAVTFFALFALRKFGRIKEALIVFFATGVITVIAGTLFPAIGAYTYYHLPAGDIANIPADAGRYFLEHFKGVRDGSMTVLNLDNQKGLVQFPSFHTQLALLSIWSLRRTIIFWPMTVINIIMIISTQAFGGHHLADVFGGAVIFAVTLWAYHRMASWQFLKGNSERSCSISGMPDWLRGAVYSLTRVEPETSL